MKNISIIIVNWNGKNDTIVCLESLRHVQIPGGLTMNIIVVDNGSADDSVLVIKKKYPNVIVLETGENLGFTGGNNFGISYALKHNASYIWLLNNDTIVDKDVLKIVDAFKDPAVGIAGSKIFFAPDHEYHHDRYEKQDRGNVIWYAGGMVDWANMYASHKGVDDVDHGQYDKPAQTDFVTGCSLMISAECVKKIGMLDDKFYLYYEDLDMNLRVKSIGYKLIYYPLSKLWHVNAGSSGGSGSQLHQYYQTRNRLLIGYRYASVRTKFALLRESMRLLISGTAVQKKAIIDAALGKWGKQYEPKKTTS